MASAAEDKLFAEATITDQDAAKFFGIAIGVLIGLFSIGHCVSKYSNKLVARSSSFNRTIRALIAPIKRAVNGIAVRGILVLPGRILIALVYFAINMVLTFTNVNWEQQTLFAKRLGWMTLCNLCLTVFLGLKNTPLSPLAGQSYESLNVLHRCCGYTTVLLSILHSSIYVSGLGKADALWVMRAPEQYAGATAGLAMLVIFVSAVGFIRKRQYELFYVTHVVMVAVILAMAGFHTYQPPDISPRTMIILALAVALWVSDRFFRFGRWIYYATGNYCTLSPLPEGATRVVLHRDIKATPGSHVFLWIPGVRMLQTHPFTLVANEPAEFVIAARDGFTRALHEAAITTKQGQKLRAAVEGPYGRVPDARTFDRIVLVAGGSGATFTFALALNWARNVRLRKHKSTLDFVWAVKSVAYLQWFNVELAELRENPAVNLSIYITGDKLPNGDVSPRSATSEDTVDREKKDAATIWSVANTQSPFGTGRSAVFRYGRPDVDGIVEYATGNLSSTKKVLVAGSGPDGLMTDVRVAASTRMRADLPSVHLHLEEFEW